MKSGHYVFLLFLLIALASFYPALGAGFVFDFVGWQRLYNAGLFADVIHCFGYRGNQQVYHLFTYTLYRLFHLQVWPWYLAFCGLHALNGYLLWCWIRQTFTNWKILIPNIFVFLGCFLFLVHPYTAEAVVFKSCIHYLLSLTWILLLLFWMPKYLKTGSLTFFGLIVLVFLLFLFTLEISYVLPLLATVYVMVYRFAMKEVPEAKQRSIYVAGSLWALLCFGLIINKITLGSWVGHYGAAVHLKVDFWGMMSTELKYFVKHLFDARMLPSAWKVKIFDQLLSNHAVIAALLLAGVGSLILYLLKIKSINPRWHLVVFCFLAAALTIAPVSNLYFYYQDVGMNDRFSYIPLAFTWMGVVGLIATMSKRNGVILLSGLILVQLFLQQRILRYWNESTEVLSSLKDDYRWQDNPFVFVLASPDNYNGIWMTQMIKGDSGIDELIDYQTKKPNSGKMYDVFQFNMITKNDGVRVEQTGPMELKVTFNQWGNWWHLHGMGGTAYENEYYKAEPLDYPYKVTFKQFPEGSVIIYQDSMRWKVFDMRMDTFKNIER